MDVRLVMRVNSSGRKKPEPLQFIHYINALNVTEPQLGDLLAQDTMFYVIIFKNMPS